MGEVVLKPCPFCGHAAVLLLHDSGDASVRCDRPLDHTGCCAVNPISFADTAGEAAEAWNTRPLVDAELTTLRARAERAEARVKVLEGEWPHGVRCGHCNREITGEVKMGLPCAEAHDGFGEIPVQVITCAECWTRGGDA